MSIWWTRKQREATTARPPALEGEDDEGVIEQRGTEPVGVWSRSKQASSNAPAARPHRGLAQPRRLPVPSLRTSKYAGRAPLLSVFRHWGSRAARSSRVFTRPGHFYLWRLEPRSCHLARPGGQTLPIGMQVDLVSGDPSRWGPLCGQESGSAAVLARPGSGGADWDPKICDKALRAATFHPKSSRYPLMATSDDGWSGLPREGL